VTRAATPAWLLPSLPICEALAALLAPHGEIAVHDLATERVVAVWNPLAGRRVGEDSLLGDLPGAGTARADGDLVFGPYPRVLIDGRIVTSVSAVLTDADGRRRGLLCVNVDRSPLDRIAALATSLLAAPADRPAELFDGDWRERIALRVQELCLERGLTRDRLDRDHRLALVSTLDAEGLFAVRGAAELAARAVGVSRATVYALLKESRSTKETRS
jgi:predicted transcriptional regulator YheO